MNEPGLLSLRNAMQSYRVRPCGPLRGQVDVPGDKSIGHRALIFAALARGRCTIRGLSEGLDNVATREAFQQMGVAIEQTADGIHVQGVGLRGLRMPTAVIDCGNSGTTMRLLAGLLAAQQFGTRLVGDASLTRRPMGRVIEPLRARGAHVAGTIGDDPEKIYPPISIAPLVAGESLAGIEYDMPIASAQVKSCLLLSGLYAAGPTVVREPVVSRDHTERMLVALGVPLQSVASAIMLDPNAQWSKGWDPFDWTVPGDPSSAAFPLLAALMVKRSAVTVSGVCVNPTRTGLLDALRAMGVGLATRSQGEAAGDEPTAAITAQHQAVHGQLIGGELLVRMIDEVPALCALAASARGTTEIRDAEELRVKESDRIAVMHQVLDAFGVPNQELPDGLIIEGGAALTGARVHSHGDHRIAMAAVLLGCIAAGETIVDDVACVGTSFPTFVPLMRSLGAEIEMI